MDADTNAYEVLGLDFTSAPDDGAIKKVRRARARVEVDFGSANERTQKTLSTRSGGVLLTTIRGFDTRRRFVN